MLETKQQQQQQEYLQNTGNTEIVPISNVQSSCRYLLSANKYKTFCCSHCSQFDFVSPKNVDELQMFVKHVKFFFLCIFLSHFFYQSVFFAEKFHQSHVSAEFSLIFTLQKFVWVWTSNFEAHEMITEKMHMRIHLVIGRSF